MKIFDLDSPLMNVLNKMADLMWLNILTLLHPCHYRWSCADFHALCGIEDRA